MTRFVPVLYVALILGLWTESAFAREPEPAKGKRADIQELVLGDTYVIDAEIGGVNEELTGALVKVNDHWIVLHTMFEARSERHIPILNDIPYVNRIFRNVGIARWGQHTWIPRKIAAVRGRTLAKEKTNLDQPGNQPDSSSFCVVRIARNGAFSEISGELGELTRDKVELNVEELESAYVPILNWLPYLGEAYFPVENTMRTVDRKIAMNDVLCIQG